MAQTPAIDLDDHVVEASQRKAELHGHSLEQELRLALTSAARLTTSERVMLSRRIPGLTPPEQTDSTALVRRHRDRR